MINALIYSYSKAILAAALHPVYSTNCDAIAIVVFGRWYNRTK